MWLMLDNEIILTWFFIYFVAKSVKSLEMTDSGW